MTLCFFSEIASFLFTPSYILNNRIMPPEGGGGEKVQDWF